MNDENVTSHYNYASAWGATYPIELFEASTPVGGRLADGKIVGLDGVTRSLSDLVDEGHVILEFGSITCPFCVDVSKGMDTLQRTYESAGFRFIFVYTREAHPGERYPSHRSMPQKLKQAKEFAQLTGTTREVFVDDLDGTLHRAYGLLPNMTWLLRQKTGTILYKASWTKVDSIHSIIKDIMVATLVNDAGNKNYNPVTVHRMEFCDFDPNVYFDGLKRAGLDALTHDFGRSLIRQNKAY